MGNIEEKTELEKSYNEQLVFLSDKYVERIKKSWTDKDAYKLYEEFLAEKKRVDDMYIPSLIREHLTKKIFVIVNESFLRLQNDNS